MPLLDAIDEVELFVNVFTGVYVLVLIVFILLSWVRLPPSLGPMQRFLYDVCDPYLRFWRRLLPFSVGPHVCIGATLAMSEILITFAVLARRFRFRLVPDQRIEPIAWTSLRPGRGIHMRVEKRSRSGAARENSADAAAAAG